MRRLCGAKAIIFSLCPAVPISAPFPVPTWTRPVGRRTGESITHMLQQRHHMTARCVKLFIVLIVFCRAFFLAVWWTRGRSCQRLLYVECRVDCVVCDRLQKEVNELREALRVLEAKLREAEDALVRLRKTRTTLEQDIQTKDRSLDIDAKVCLGLRKKMATDPKGCPMITVPLIWVYDRVIDRPQKELSRRRWLRVCVLRKLEPVITYLRI